MAKPVTAKQPNAVPEGFDPVPHLRYRMYLPAIIGRSELAVYDALRSLVWRSERGPERLVALMNKGMLVAKADQSTLAAITGLSRQHVCGFLQRLVQLGWVVQLPCENASKARIYALGIRRQTSKAWAETDYAEEVMRGWYVRVEKLALDQHGQSYKKLSAKAQKGLVSQVVPDSIQRLKKELKETPERLKDFNKIRHLQNTTSGDFFATLSPEVTTALSPEATTENDEKTAQPTEILGGFSNLKDGPIDNYKHKQLKRLHSGYFVTLHSAPSDADDSATTRSEPATQAASSLRSLASRPVGPACVLAPPSELFPRPRPAPAPANDRPTDRRPHTPPVPPAPLAPRRAAADTFGLSVTALSQPRSTPTHGATAANGPQNAAEADPATFPLPCPENRS